MANDFLQGITERFPKELLKGRLQVEGNVIACLMKDMLLLDDCGLNRDFFFTKDGLFYFGLLNHLRQKKFTSLDEVTILSNTTEEVQEKYKELGGWTAIQNLMNVINMDNYDVYLDALYKEDTICRLYLDGFNLFNPVKNQQGKDIIPIEVFRKLSNEEVLDWYESRLTGYNSGSTSKIVEEGYIEFDDAFLDGCMEGEENGVPFGKAGLDINGKPINVYPFLSNQICGFLSKYTSMIGGYSSAGKTTYLTAILIALAAQGRKILVISNEDDMTKYKVRFLLWILHKYNRYDNITKHKLLGGALTEEDQRQIAIARKYWDENYGKMIKFEYVSEVDMNLYKKLIRKHVLREGFDTVLVDTFKMDYNNMSNSRTDLDLVRDSRTLDALAKQYDLIMLASVQLSIHTTGQLFLDASVLSNSKQVKEVLENLFLMRTVYNNEEFDPTNKYYCHPFQTKKNEQGEYIEIPFEPNKAMVWRMLFVNKCRSGVNSDDNGVAYLLQFDGDHGVFKEVAKCRPKHGFISA